VSKSHLRITTIVVTDIPAVHRTASARRSEPADQTGDRPLGESGQPRRTSADGVDQVSELRAIITWLDVPHKARYQAHSGATYCNIYAYDYCYLAGVYLPRVWWTDAALEKLQSGEQVAVSDATTEEKTANQLLSWVQKYDPLYGWVHTASLTELQEKANSGAVALICAKRKAGHHGHIVAVVPESNAFHAIRDAGRVTRPLQSQAQ
jgi:hypothetical protein